MSDMIPASRATLGGWYDTFRGRRVQVRRKNGDQVVLFSKCTGHEVPVPPDYLLRPFYETLFV